MLPLLWLRQHDLSELHQTTVPVWRGVSPPSRFARAPLAATIRRRRCWGRSRRPRANVPADREAPIPGLALPRAARTARGRRRPYWLRYRRYV